MPPPSAPLTAAASCSGAVTSPPPPAALSPGPSSSGGRVRLTSSGERPRRTLSGSFVLPTPARRPAAPARACATKARFFLGRGLEFPRGSIKLAACPSGAAEGRAESAMIERARALVRAQPLLGGNHSTRGFTTAPTASRAAPRSTRHVAPVLRSGVQQSECQSDQPQRHSTPFQAFRGLHPQPLGLTWASWACFYFRILVPQLFP